MAYVMGNMVLLDLEGNRIGCSTGVSIDTQREKKRIIKKGGPWKEWKPKGLSYSISHNQIILVGDEDNILSLVDYYKNATLLVWQIGSTQVNEPVWTGNARITRLSKIFNMNTVSAASIVLEGHGDLYYLEQVGRIFSQEFSLEFE